MGRGAAEMEAGLAVVALAGVVRGVAAAAAGWAVEGVEADSAAVAAAGWAAVGAEAGSGVAAAAAAEAVAGLAADMAGWVVQEGSAADLVAAVQTRCR